MNFKNLVVLGLVAITQMPATPAHAQQRGNGPTRADASFIQEVNTLTSDILRNVNYLNVAQRQAILSEFEIIRNIMQGRYTPTTPTTPYPYPAPYPTPYATPYYPPAPTYPTVEYTCASRDNDGRSPYVFAIREGINVRRIANTYYNTDIECKNAIASIRFLGSKGVYCSARDNDDREPYTLTFIEGDRVTKLSKTVSTKNECTDNLARMKITYNNTAVFCTSRDNDGRSPYRAVELNLESGEVKGGSESFSSIGECRNFIGI